MMFATEDLVCE